MIDYHLHTSLCNHASGSMDQYIDKAIDLGIEEICFLDHLTIDASGKTQSMGLMEVPMYLQSVRRLSHAYRDRIKILAGLEVDFNISCLNIIEDVLGSYSFDLIGGSVHFVDDVNIASRRAVSRLAGKNVDRLYEGYVKKMDTMLDHDFFDVVCHLDVIKKTGLKPSRPFDDEFETLLRKIAEKGKAVEFNAGGYDHPAKEPYPSFSLLKKCCELGIGITFGSDAHSPDSVGGNFHEAVSCARKAGYSHLLAFDKRVPLEKPF